MVGLPARNVNCHVAAEIRFDDGQLDGQRRHFQRRSEQFHHHHLAGGKFVFPPVESLKRWKQPIGHRKPDVLRQTDTEDHWPAVNPFSFQLFVLSTFRRWQ